MIEPGVVPPHNLRFSVLSSDFLELPTRNLTQETGQSRFGAVKMSSIEVSGPF
jgi:hypothetical protein